MEERIQKIIAQTGLCSRRKAEELIEKGKVNVNGKTAKIGEKADAEKDKIAVEGKQIQKEKKLYYLINKPKGIVCSLKKQKNEQIITDLIKTKERIFPIGRLDKDTTGLLLMTNDGELNEFITHPSKETTKTYEAELDRELSEEDIRIIKKGLNVEGRKVEVKDITVKGKKVTIKIHEGRKHIVKKIFARLGCEVVELKRTMINELKLNISIGKYRELTQKDFEKLRFKHS